MAAQGQHNHIFRFHPSGRLDAYSRHASRWDGIRWQGTFPQCNFPLSVFNSPSADDVHNVPQVLRSPTRHTLESMVAHFQKLFDAPSLTGIYPRMNEVYTKLGEMNNAMRNLRDVLDLGIEIEIYEILQRYLKTSTWHVSFLFLSELMLSYHVIDDRAPPSEVVNKVAAIVSQSGNIASPELYGLLESSDIDRYVHFLFEFLIVLNAGQIFVKLFGKTMWQATLYERVQFVSISWCIRHFIFFPIIYQYCFEHFKLYKWIYLPD